MADTRIGISGWRYPPWRGKFYPEDLTQKHELQYASRQVNSIELNGSFYSLQRPAYYQRWYDDTPDDFVFSVKGTQFITHIRRLREIEEPLANFFASGVLALKEKFGPILWQFPPNFPFDREKFEPFLDQLPHDTKQAAKLAMKHGSMMTKEKRLTETDALRPVRHAIEFRHQSFLTDEFVKLLRDRNIALVIADTARRFPYVEDITADFIYARLHGDEELYASGYSKSALDRWEDRFRTWQKGKEPRDAHRIDGPAKSPKKGRDIYVYFDNDIKVHAPFDAMNLAKRMDIKRPLEFISPAPVRKTRSRRG